MAHISISALTFSPTQTWGPRPNSRLTWRGVEFQIDFCFFLVDEDLLLDGLALRGGFNFVFAVGQGGLEFTPVVGVAYGLGIAFCVGDGDLRGLDRFACVEDYDGDGLIATDSGGRVFVDERFRGGRGLGLGLGCG